MGGADFRERDATLVAEALAVLREAQMRVPAVSALLAQRFANSSPPT